MQVDTNPMLNQSWKECFLSFPSENGAWAARRACWGKKRSLSTVDELGLLEQTCLLQTSGDSGYYAFCYKKLWWLSSTQQITEMSCHQPQFSVGKDTSQSPSRHLLANSFSLSTLNTQHVGVVSCHLWSQIHLNEMKSCNVCFQHH